MLPAWMKDHGLHNNTSLTHDLLWSCHAARQQHPFLRTSFSAAAVANLPLRLTGAIGLSNVGEEVGMGGQSLLERSRGPAHACTERGRESHTPDDGAADCLPQDRVRVEP